MRGADRALGLVIGVVADRLLGDPRRFHPVAGFGRLAAALERHSYADNRARGIAHTVSLIALAGAVGAGAQRSTRGRPLSRTVATAAATWAVLGGRSLTREAALISDQLRIGDLVAAREQVTHLVGRDPTDLGADDIARATVESLAENSSDAVVAPLFWGAIAGVPGLLGYRAINTLDAMVGHRSPRYRRFGAAAARIDDVANWLPARLSVLLTASAAAVVAGRARDAIYTARRDGPKHPSPNAGPVEAAFAGALGRSLGGVNSYHGVIEDRGTLGSGPSPDTADIARASALVRVVTTGAAVVAAVLAVALSRVGRSTR